MKSISVLLFFTFSVSLFGQNDEQTAIPEKVLFVGNSYTYFWNLPQTVGLMAKEKNIEIATFQSTAGGATLGEHWRGEKALQSIKKIKDGQFNVVVIQDHSLSGPENPDSMLVYGQLFADLIRQSGARPYLYMTWAREWNPLMQDAITQAYQNLAEKIAAEIVPVGPAWQLARQLRPGIPLFDPDGSHPSTLGTYLTGCVFFGKLSGQSPVGLPARLQTIDAQGEKLFISIVSPEDAAFLQQVAEKVIQEFKN